jgi:hypothetical protein
LVPLNLPLQLLDLTLRNFKAEQQISKDLFKPLSLLTSLTITSCGLTTFPGRFNLQGLIALKRLSLCWNEISTFYGSFLTSLCKLECLDLSQNRLRSLDPFLLELPTLKEFHASGNLLEGPLKEFVERNYLVQKFKDFGIYNKQTNKHTHKMTLSTTNNQLFVFSPSFLNIYIYTHTLSLSLTELKNFRCEENFRVGECSCQDFETS